MKTIRQKFFLFTFLCSTLPLISIGIFLIISNANQMESQIHTDFSQLARVKQSAFSDSLENVGKNLKALSNNKSIINMLKQFKDSENIQLQSQDYKNTFDVILNFQEANWGKVHHVFIADLDGNIIVSPPHGKSTGSHLNQVISNSAFWNKALKESTITDFFGFKESTHYHQLYMQPIIDKEGSTVGVIVSEIIISYLNRLLKKNISLGETGEIFILALDGTKIVNNISERKAPIQRDITFNKMTEKIITLTFDDKDEISHFGLYLNDKLKFRTL